MLALLEASNPDYSGIKRKKLGFNIKSFMFCLYDQSSCIIPEIQWYVDAYLGYRFNSSDTIKANNKARNIARINVVYDPRKRRKQIQLCLL